LFGTIGLSIGDFLCGMTSQLFRSRRKAIGLSLVLALFSMVTYLSVEGLSAKDITLLCFALGVTAGYWAVLITVAAEQFGTNLRGTVATSVPNFVRGSAMFATIAFSVLKSHMSLTRAALSVGLVCFALAFYALYNLEETFGKDLDFVEVDD
jgi:uncharacterized membrane protein YozB (DUF420 family)